MAVRFPGTSFDDAYTSTASPVPDATTGATTTWWGKISGVQSPETFICFVSTDDTDPNNATAIETASDSTELTIFRGTQTAFSGFTLVVGTWYRFAFTVGTDNTVTVFYGEETGPLNSFTINVTVNQSTRLWIGADQFGEPLNGAITNFKQYSAVLSLSEIEDELATKNIVRTADLVRNYRFDGSEPDDSSGNGFTLAGGTGVTAEADPAGLAEKTPGEILNIGPDGGQNHFSVQVAQKGAASIDIFDQDQIAAGTDIDPEFTTATSNNAVQFNAPCDGPKTSSSAAGARSELRELDEAGANITFDPVDGNDHYIFGTTKITHHPTDDIDGIGTVLAQLHNGNRDRLAFRTHMQGGSLRLRYRENGSTVWQGTDTTSGNVEIVPAGAANIVEVEFPYLIHLHDGDGSTCIADFYVNDLIVPWRTNTAFFDVDQDNDPEGWYWKTGTYNQFEPADGVSVDEFTQVELRNVEHWHTGFALPGGGTAIESVADNFDDNSIDTAIWPQSFGDGTVTETGGHLEVAPGTTITGVGSAIAFRFINTHVFAEVTPPATTGATFGWAGLTCYTPGLRNFVRLYVDSTVNETHAIIVLGGQLSFEQIFTYDPTAHAWLRMREFAGRLFFEVSPDGQTWTTLTATLTPGQIRDEPTLEFDLESSLNIGGGTLDNPAIFDNANTGVALPTTGDLTAALPGLTAELPGTVTVAGSISASLPALAGDLAARLGLELELDAALPTLIADLSERSALPAAVAAILPAPAAELTGLTVVAGDLAATLPAARADLSARVALAGELQPVLPAAIADISTGSSQPAIMAATLPAPAAELTGLMVMAGDLAATLPAARADLSARLALAGEIVAALPAPMSESSGVVVHPATMAATLPAPAAELTGLMVMAGDLAATLPAVMAEVIGAIPTTGTMSAALPALDALMFGVKGHVVAGQLAAALRPLTAHLDGSVPNGARLAATLPAPAANLAAAIPTRVQLAAGLPGLAAHVAVHVAVTVDIDLIVQPTRVGTVNIGTSRLGTFIGITRTGRGAG